MNKGIVIKGLFVAVALWCVTAALGQTAAGYVDFLYKYMPLPDRADYSRAFYEKNVAMSLQARREMPWGSLVPELCPRPWRAQASPLFSTDSVFGVLCFPLVRPACLALQ